MKLIKLNRRYKMYYEGFTHALRWDRWEFDDIKPYEKSIQNLYGYMSYNYSRSAWVSAFGSSVDRKTGYKPYFIYVRNENMLTMTMLKAQNE